MATQKVFESFDAIVFEPVILRMVFDPRVHPVVGPGFPLYIRMEAGAPTPEVVDAVALVDGYSCYGRIPTDRIGIGCKNEGVHFEDQP